VGTAETLPYGSTREPASKSRQRWKHGFRVHVRIRTTTKKKKTGKKMGSDLLPCFCVKTIHSKVLETENFQNSRRGFGKGIWTHRYIYLRPDLVASVCVCVCVYAHTHVRHSCEGRIEQQSMTKTRKAKLSFGECFPAESSWCRCFNRAEPYFLLVKQLSPWFEGRV